MCGFRGVPVEMPPPSGVNNYTTLGPDRGWGGFSCFLVPFCPGHGRAAARPGPSWFCRCIPGCALPAPPAALPRQPPCPARAVPSVPCRAPSPSGPVSRRPVAVPAARPRRPRPALSGPSPGRAWGRRLCLSGPSVVCRAAPCPAPRAVAPGRRPGPSPWAAALARLGPPPARLSGRRSVWLYLVSCGCRWLLAGRLAVSRFRFPAGWLCGLVGFRGGAVSSVRDGADAGEGLGFAVTPKEGRTLVSAPPCGFGWLRGGGRRARPRRSRDRWPAWSGTG